MAVVGASGAGAGAGAAAGPAGSGAPVVAGGGGASDLEMMAVWLATVVVVVGPVVEVVVVAAAVCGSVAAGPEASAWAGIGTVSRPVAIRSDASPAAVIRPWRPVRDGSVTSP